MGKLKKIFSNISDSIRETYKKFPMTIIVVYMLTLIYAFGILAYFIFLTFMFLTLNQLEKASKPILPPPCLVLTTSVPVLAQLVLWDLLPAIQFSEK